MGFASKRAARRRVGVLCLVAGLCVVAPLGVRADWPHLRGPNYDGVAEASNLADAWPAGDLALQEAARLAFGLRKRPTTKEMGPLAEKWRPYRAVAARLLWSYYRVMKKREGVLTEPAAKQKKKRAKNAR